MSDDNNVCAGTLITFTATPVNGGLLPTYQWFNGLTPVGTDSPVYAYVPANGDVISVVLTSSEICTSGNPATSNTIEMTVNPLLPVSVSIVSDDNNVCAGTLITFTATPVNGGLLPTYQWFNGITPVGTDSPVYAYVPENGDVISVVLTSSEICTSGNPATSNAIEMTVNPLLPVSVSIVADDEEVCEGTLVTFTATPVNGGLLPTYQWFNGVTPVGTDSPVYSYVPANGDAITVVLTSSEICTSGNPAISNLIVMTVNPILPVSVTIVADANPVCAGTVVTFTATPVNGGLTPTYQWFNGVTPVGSNNPVYAYMPLNGDAITVVLTSSEVCTSGSPATSNIVVMTVNGIPAATASNSGPLCVGSTLNLFGGPDGMDSYLWTTPNGGWFSNEQNPVINSVALADGGLYTLTVMDNGCSAVATTEVVVNAIPSAPVIVESAVGDVLTSSAPEGNQWYYSSVAGQLGTAIEGATGQTYQAILSGWYTSIVTLNGCVSQPSNQLYVIITGQEELPSSSSFTLYPVPNNGLFTASILYPVDDTFTITVYNQLGVKLFEMADVKIVGGKFATQIDLRPVSVGVYTVVFTNNEHKVVKKVLINK